MMRQIHFPDWPRRLAGAPLDARQKESFGITLRWFLNFCRRGRVGVDADSARQFIAWAQEQKQPDAWQLEGWKEAIRWFFREARQAGAGTAKVAAPARRAESRAREGVAVTAGSVTSAKGGPAPALDWRRAFVTVVRRRHYSYRTEQSYLVWLERFARFCRSEELQSRGPEDIKAFLDALARDERLSASSQRQALNAVVFLLREVFGQDVGDFSDFRRAKIHPHAPVWLTPNETTRLLEQLPPEHALLARVAFGSGVRLMELLRLRVHPVR